jgi:hypothetical protein
MGDDATMPQLALARLRANGDFGEDRGVDLLRLRCFATDMWSDGDSLLVGNGAIMTGIHTYIHIRATTIATSTLYPMKIYFGYFKAK